MKCQSNVIAVHAGGAGTSIPPQIGHPPLFASLVAAARSRAPAGRRHASSARTNEHAICNLPSIFIVAKVALPRPPRIFAGHKHGGAALRLLLRLAAKIWTKRKRKNCSVTSVAYCNATLLQVVDLVPRCSLSFLSSHPPSLSL